MGGFILKGGVFIVFVVVGKGYFGIVFVSGFFGIEVFSYLNLSINFYGFVGMFFVVFDFFGLGG